MVKLHSLKLGTTFSQLQCHYLGMDYKKTFKEIIPLNLNYIRLCAYWNEIEKIKGKFNFIVLDWLIKQCEKHSIKIVLAVGMKTPRWPEFHFPKWIEEICNTTRTDKSLDNDEKLAEQALIFVKKVIKRYKNRPICYWQIENEALNKVGVANRRYLSKEFIEKEIKLLKKHVPKSKILLTNSINMFPLDKSDEKIFKDSIALADAIGINVYTKVPINSRHYIKPLPFFWKKLARWHKELTESKKQAWAVEVQAEPWEHNKLVAIDKLEYPSTSPKAMLKLVNRLAKLNYNPILLWGCEYWVWHKQQGSLIWIEAISKLKKPFA